MYNKLNLVLEFLYESDKAVNVSEILNKHFNIETTTEESDSIMEKLIKNGHVVYNGIPSGIPYITITEHGKKFYEIGGY